MVHAPPLLQSIGPVANFQDSHRYVLSYRSYRDPSLHATTLIYRHASAPDDEAGKDWWAITGECPHLGAPLEHGAIEHGAVDIEDLGDDPSSAPIIICPWHSYDFTMDTGESSSGLRACTYAVETRDEILFVEPPGDLGDAYRLLGVRAVSEKFAESATLEPTPDFFTDPPKTLVAFCRLVLLTSDPDAKVALTREMVRQFRSGELKTIGTADDLPPPDEPPRPKSTVTVAPGKAKRIGRGGTAETRVRLMHSLASIEQWAIDLALDVIARFWNWRQGAEDGRNGKKLPMSFFADYLKIAEDEAKHFSLLRERMKELGTTYGDLPVHSGLWESARETSHNLFSRLAIIGLVHEARGLDTNPRAIERCRAAGDAKTADMLQVIHDDELTHVAVGHKHFTGLCANMSPFPLDPVMTFRREVQDHFHGSLRGPYNAEDREKAGLSREWYEDLHGKAFSKETRDAEVRIDGLGEEVAALSV